MTLDESGREREVRWREIGGDDGECDDENATNTVAENNTIGRKVTKDGGDYEEEEYADAVILYLYSVLSDACLRDRA